MGSHILNFNQKQIQYRYEVIYHISFTGTGAAPNTRVMSIAVVTATDILVFVGGVFQNPATAYTVDGSTTITFTSSPPNLENIVVLHGLTEVA